MERLLTTFLYSEIVKSSGPPPKSYKLNLTDCEMKNESTKNNILLIFFFMYWRLYRLKLNDLSIKETIKVKWSNCCRFRGIWNDTQDPDLTRLVGTIGTYFIQLSYDFKTMLI